VFQGGGDAGVAAAGIAGTYEELVAVFPSTMTSKSISLSWTFPGIA